MSPISGALPTKATPRPRLPSSLMTTPALLCSFNSYYVRITPLAARSVSSWPAGWRNHHANHIGVVYGFIQQFIITLFFVQNRTTTTDVCIRIQISNKPLA